MVVQVAKEHEADSMPVAVLLCESATASTRPDNGIAPEASS